MAQRARMIDVARAAGVSTMTVSRTLNGNPHVTEDTRQRVLAAIEQLHYHRNELARSLRDKRTRQIGILVPNLFDPFFANCAHAVGIVAKQHNYSVNIGTTNDDPDDEFDEAQRMLYRNVEGVVVIPAAPIRGTSRLHSPTFSNLTIVSMDRPLDGNRYDSVLVQNRNGGQLGTGHLLALGHKRIAFISLDANIYTMRMRQQGYRETMTAAGLKPDVCIVTYTFETSASTLRKLMAVKRPPTALFCANNLITQHVLRSLQMLNMHPPESVALIGFDDFETADLLQPGITVIRQPVESMGRIAAEVLFARLGEASHGQPRRITLPVELVVRGSCGAPLP
jgi:LacI family transcriptional regulator